MPLPCSLVGASRGFLLGFAMWKIAAYVKRRFFTRNVRIWMDGVYDLMHYGHANAFRLGKNVGTYLIVGINDDDSVAQCKGPPVMSSYEREASVRACRWVDDVVSNVPYIMSDDYVRYIIRRYRIDYIVHGDDPCLVDGRDVYESARALGKYHTISRTEGVSTSDLLSRMLMAFPKQNEGGAPLPLSTKSKFMATSHLIRQFSKSCPEISGQSRVVYVDGAWDLFHAGHAEFLKTAATFGDYLIVGVHSDILVHARRGSGHPILSMSERALSVLSCKYVDDVVFDAPWSISHEMIGQFKISAVVRGTIRSSYCVKADLEDPYEVPKLLNIFHCVTSSSLLNVQNILDRVHSKHEHFSKRMVKKMQDENGYYKRRYNI